MLESYFESEGTLDRLRSGPSGAYVDGFAQMLNGEGYSCWTARRYLRSAAHLGRFVEAEGSALSTINGEVLDTFRLHLPKCECPQSNGGTTLDVVHGARAFVRYLASIGVLKDPESGGEGDEPQLIGLFRRWLKEHGGVAESTSYNYCRGATKIIETLGADPETYDAENLRAGDVVGLRFSDIDWADASFLVSGKGRREVRLPLPQEVGDALLTYLEIRPKVVTDQVFLRAVAPFRPFRCSGAVSAIVRRAIRRAGIDAPSNGAHILRHSAATQMLHEGASLYQVGAVLRHSSRDMTAHYAKTDVALLKLVARPWPEVLGC